MKLTSLACLSALVALLCPTFSARALDPSLFNDGFAPLTPALAQFFTDLEAIPAGSVVTDAQHATLLADLTALPPGPAAPDAATLDALATDFGAVAVAGLIDDDLEYQLAMDFDVDADDPDSWLAYVQNDVQFALNPPAPVDPTMDPGLPYETVGPVSTTASIRTSEVYTRRADEMSQVVYNVAKDGRSSYYGDVLLTTFARQGSVPLSTLTVSTYGLSLHRRYTVTATRRSDGGSVVLGTFRVHGSGLPSGPTGITLNTGHLYRPPTMETRSAVTYGAGAKHSFPTGFDVSDVGIVSVLDARGQTRMSSYPNESTMRARRVHLALTGPAGSSATGRITTKYQGFQPVGNTRNLLHLNARHLPPNASVTLTVDGVMVGRYATTAGGRLLIAQRAVTKIALRPGDRHIVNPLPKEVDLSKAQSVSLVDAVGNVLLSGSL